MAIQPLPSGQLATPPQNPNDPNDPTSLLMSYFGLDADTQPSPLASNMDPASPSDYLAALAGIPHTSGALTRGTMRDVSGNVSPDYTRSRYNEELDAQSQQFDAANAVRQAADDASARKQAEEAVAPTITAAGGIEQEKMKEAADKYKADQGLAATGLKAGGGVKLTSTEQAVVDAGIAGNNEGDRVRQMLEARHPDIAANPDKYSSVTDRLPSAIGNLLIAHGVAAGTHTNSTEMNTAITQLQANIAKMKSSGRLSGAIYDKLIQGMPQAGFSDGENYKRLASTQADLDDVLGGVAQAHGAQLTDLTHSGAQAPADTSASDYNDPAGLR